MAALPRLGKGRQDRRVRAGGMAAIETPPWAHAIDHAHERTRTGGEQMILILGLVRPLVFAVWATLADGQNNQKAQ